MDKRKLLTDILTPKGETDPNFLQDILMTTAVAG
jgi:hypothetical protein